MKGLVIAITNMAKVFTGAFGRFENLAIAKYHRGISDANINFGIELTGVSLASCIMTRTMAFAVRHSSQTERFDGPIDWHFGG